MKKKSMKEELIIVKGKDVDPNPTPEEIEMMEAAEKLPIVYDEDCPELTPEQLSQMRRLYDDFIPERRKKTVSLRLSPATFEKAKALGKGYTSVLSRLLDLALNDPEMVKKCL